MALDPRVHSEHMPPFWALRWSGKHTVTYHYLIGEQWGALPAEYSRRTPRMQPVEMIIYQELAGLAGWYGVSLFTALGSKKLRTCQFSILQWWISHVHCSLIRDQCIHQPIEAHAKTGLPKCPFVDGPRWLLQNQREKVTELASAALAKFLENQHQFPAIVAKCRQWFNGVVFLSRRAESWWILDTVHSYLLVWFFQLPFSWVSHSFLRFIHDFQYLWNDNISYQLSHLRFAGRAPRLRLGPRQ